MPILILMLSEALGEGYKFHHRTYLGWIKKNGKICLFWGLPKMGTAGNSVTHLLAACMHAVRAAAVSIIQLEIQCVLALSLEIHPRSWSVLLSREVDYSVTRLLSRFTGTRPTSGSSVTF